MFISQYSANTTACRLSLLPDIFNESRSPVRVSDFWVYEGIGECPNTLNWYARPLSLFLQEGWRGLGGSLKFRPQKGARSSSARTANGEYEIKTGVSMYVYVDLYNESVVGRIRIHNQTIQRFYLPPQYVFRRAFHAPVVGAVQQPRSSYEGVYPVITHIYGVSRESRSATCTVVRRWNACFQLGRTEETDFHDRAPSIETRLNCSTPPSSPHRL